MDIHKYITKENVNNIVEGAEVLLCSTDKGLIVVGMEDEILTCLKAIVDNLVKKGMSKVAIEKAIKEVLKDNEKSDTDIFIKTVLKELKKDIEEMLGDEEDE